MFNKKKLDKLKFENERLKEDIKIRDRLVKELGARLDVIEKGERCEGGYCKHCKYAIKGDVIELFTDNNRVLTFGENATICALSVPCPDFQWEEDK